MLKQGKKAAKKTGDENPMIDELKSEILGLAERVYKAQNHQQLTS